MIKVMATVFLVTVASVIALPASNEQLDKNELTKSSFYNTVTEIFRLDPKLGYYLDKNGNIRGSFYTADKELSRSYRKLESYLDKATINDVGVNTVSEEKKIEQSVQSPQPQAPTSSVHITGITTRINPPQPSPPAEDTPFKPVRAGSMFARFIDDIFQIPIAVLQSVARLITNPFTQKKSPEVVATVS